MLVNGEPVLSCGYTVNDDITVVFTGSDQLMATGNNVPQRNENSAGSLPAEPAPTCRSGNTGVKTKVDSEKGTPVLGIAFDLGTTGLSACLLDITIGDNLGTASRLNPQCRFGGDVLTRIAYCRDNEGGLEALRNLVYGELSSIADELLQAGGYETDCVYKVAVAGNTTMLHIFAGVSPETISYYPYEPVFTDPVKLSDLPIPINPAGVVTLLPSVSGYIGGDITAGLAAVDFLNTETTALFIDIGTNGEMVLARNNSFYAASTAAGPALEGMSITCGTRAVPGAIEHVSVTNGELRFDVIGEGTPVGICGSGLIDLTACLLEIGIIDSSGKLDTSGHGVHDKKYYLTETIYISQKDIRQIQLAKSAIASGIQLLLKASGAECGELEQIYIAGSFG